MYCLGGMPAEENVANGTACVTKVSGEDGISVSGLRTQ
jgi:hypothetical protein